AGYLLRQWHVDCTKAHSLQGPEYQLWLKNTPTLYGVANLNLAPGFDG
ncbi:WYL domain-containing protein, partial [Providencia rettgeri]